MAVNPRTDALRALDLRDRAFTCLDLAVELHGNGAGQSLIQDTATRFLAFARARAGAISCLKLAMPHPGNVNDYALANPPVEAILDRASGYLKFLDESAAPGA